MKLSTPSVTAALDMTALTSIKCCGQCPTCMLDALKWTSNVIQPLHVSAMSNLMENYISMHMMLLCL